MSALPIPARELFINGRWTPPARGQYLDVVTPSTELVIGRIPAGTAEDVDAAVAAAVAAHKNGSWGRTTGKQRAVVMRALAQKVLPWHYENYTLLWALNCLGPVNFGFIMPKQNEKLVSGYILYCSLLRASMVM